MIRNNSDVAIIGSGLIGLITAFSLVKLGISVTIIDKEKISDPDFISKDIRTTAIAEGSKTILEKLGVWRHIKKYCEPIRYIKVYDRNSSNKISFSNKLNDNYLGYIIENRFLKNFLIKKIITNKNISIVDKQLINEIKVHDDYVHIKSNNKNFYSSLLVASDGKNSFVRKSLKQLYYSKNYNQKALVVNFLHLKNHNNTAYEIFYDSGPLATLPMPQQSNKFYSSSLIWSHTPSFINSLDKVDNKFLLTILNEKIEKILGKTVKILNKQIFPLSAHINTHFSSKRVIYIGDAAHSIHPIAGQGWNLGMRDIIALIDIMLEAQSLGLDLGSNYISEKFHNTRYFDAFCLYQVTDKLNCLFMSENYKLKNIRNYGFNIIDNNKRLSSRITDFAMGYRL